MAASRVHPVATRIIPLGSAASVGGTVAQNEWRSDECNRWAAPLQVEIVRTVAANLSPLLGTGRETLSTNAAVSSLEYRASIELERFESVLGQAASVEAEWWVRRTADGVSRSCRTVAHENVNGSDFRALAAAHSRAIEHGSEDIVAAVRNLKGAGI